MKEAQWLNQKYIPTVEEHREVSVLVTGTCRTLFVIAYVGMGDVATKETFDWMFTMPKIVEASSIISRSMDDTVGHKVRISTKLSIKLALICELITTCFCVLYLYITYDQILVMNSDKFFSGSMCPY